jgi:hypothetical protein
MTEIYRRVGVRANEGEGNRTATHNFDRAEALFAKSGKVAPKASEARKAIDGAEGPELAKAEKAGKAGPAHTDTPPFAKR